MAVETIEITKTREETTYKSVIDGILESGVKEGRELFEALNALYVKPSRWVPVPPKTNGYKPNSQE